MKNLGLIPEALIVTIGAFVLTAAIFFVGIHFGWTVWPLNPYEFIGTALNFSCVYLCTRQNIVQWPIGIIAVVLFGIFFNQLQLYSSMALSLGYFIPAQLLGWLWWYRGGVIQSSDNLPVTWLSTDLRILSIITLPIIWVAVSLVDMHFGGGMAFFDSAIFTLSITAQWLMNHKKLESWLFWIVVNVISVYTYFSAGSFLLGVQYAIFLGNALYGLYMWRKDMIKPAPVFVTGDQYI